jgi:hypothetical protein
MSKDGKIVAVASPLSDIGSFNAGAVRIYRLDENLNMWVQLGDVIVGEAVEDLSGESTLALSADGMRVLIGASRNEGSTADTAGHVRVFEYLAPADYWYQLGADIDGEAPMDFSGISGAISNEGHIIAVGAHLNDGNGLDAGHVRVFKFDGSGWVQLGDDIDGGFVDNQFGSMIALSGNGLFLAVASSIATDTILDFPLMSRH